MASYVKDKKNILVRLKKMEGQLQGVRRMVEEERYCVDVLNQLSSVVAATHKVAAIIMKDHLQGCVSNALKNDERSEEMINELMKAVERFTTK